MSIVHQIVIRCDARSGTRDACSETLVITIPPAPFDIVTMQWDALREARWTHEGGRHLCKYHHYNPASKPNDEVLT